MSKRTKWSLAGVIVVALVAIGGLTAAKSGKKGVEVRIEAVESQKREIREHGQHQNAKSQSPHGFGERSGNSQPRYPHCRDYRERAHEHPERIYRFVGEQARDNAETQNHDEGQQTFAPGHGSPSGQPRRR